MEDEQKDRGVPGAKQIRDESIRDRRLRNPPGRPTLHALCLKEVSCSRTKDRRHSHRRDYSGTCGGRACPFSPSLYLALPFRPIIPSGCEWGRSGFWGNRRFWIIYHAYTTTPYYYRPKQQCSPLTSIWVLVRLWRVIVFIFTLLCFFSPKFHFVTADWIF